MTKKRVGNTACIPEVSEEYNELDTPIPDKVQTLRPRKELRERGDKQNDYFQDKMLAILCAYLKNAKKLLRYCNEGVPIPILVKV